MNYYDQTEKYLLNYFALKISIENMQKQIKEIMVEDGLTAINYDGEKIAETHKTSCPTEKTAIRNIIKSDMLNKRINKNKLTLSRIDDAIKALKGIDQNIIKLRYIEGYQWYIVSSKVSYSQSHCRKKAIDAVYKISVALFGEDALKELG